MSSNDGTTVDPKINHSGLSTTSTAENPSKKPRLDPIELDKKERAIGCILHWHEWAAFEFKVEHNHIDGMATISSFIFTAHSRLIKAGSGKGGLIAKTDAVGIVHKIGSITKKPSDFEKGIEKISKAYGFSYKRGAPKNESIGSLNALVALVVGWELRLTEVRMGNLKISKGRSEETRPYNLEHYGMNKRHDALLAGVCFAPSIQSAMKGGLGPMTVAIILCETSQEYQDKWKKTFVEIFKLLPFAQELADALAGSGQRKVALLKALADICLFGIARAQNKAFIPASMLMSVARDNGTYTAFATGGASPEGIVKIPEEMKSLNFSGIGLYSFWQRICTGDRKFWMATRTKGGESEMGQMLFHSIFGTHREDLSLVEWMTGEVFKTRNEMGDHVKQKLKEGTEQTFLKMIPYKYISNLAYAAQTDFISGGQGQISRVPVFSGYCSQNVDLDGELFKVLTTQQQMHFYSGTSVFEKLMRKLERVKEIIQERIKKDMAINFRTTDFTEVQGMNLNKYGAVIKFPGKLKGKYFFKQEV